jgi:hypothetical protein
MCCAKSGMDLVGARKSRRFFKLHDVHELQKLQPRTENQSKNQEPGTETEHELSTEKQKGELLSLIE